MPNLFAEATLVGGCHRTRSSNCVEYAVYALLGSSIHGCSFFVWLGANHSNFWIVCPQNESAVLKGLTVFERYRSYTNEKKRRTHMYNIYINLLPILE